MTEKADGIHKKTKTTRTSGSLAAQKRGVDQDFFTVLQVTLCCIGNAETSVDSIVKAF